VVREDMRNKLNIKYVSGNEVLLDSIRLLWEGLNQHNFNLSPYFKRYYVEMDFEKRKASLLKKTVSAELRVDIAMDVMTGQNVGYCVSSINQEKTGEIESIFVASNYRGWGIGDSLMKTALTWMNEKRAVAKIVEVAVGNEQAFGFYNRYGFCIRKTVLKQVMKG
jgi:ribosomal protein S18 acetylase RimI-like enzyme